MKKNVCKAVTYVEDHCHMMIHYEVIPEAGPFSQQGPEQGVQGIKIKIKIKCSCQKIKILITFILLLNGPRIYHLP